MKKFKHKIRQGYTVFNMATKKFVDYGGNESVDCYETYETPEDAREILSEIDWYINMYDNKHSRRLKEQRINMVVVTLELGIENTFGLKQVI